ncbi:GGDEF domain-containing protein [Aureimonas populi]|uniref:diguanylate cyclase n=1 Tax=Aureimonas populi TaxID=1701758 RepID=A0ABW5CN88_9HYPH|nr:GGDEF domain-containing protein [Aureimonas populi]
MAETAHASKMNGVRTANLLDSFDRFAAWLLRRTAWQGWALVLLPVAAIAWADLTLASADAINLRSLYVLPVTLACWMFGPRRGLAVVALVVGCMYARHPLLFGEAGVVPFLVSGLIRATSFTVVALIVLGFRRLYEGTARMARQDGMTGALNRTAFEAEARSMVEAARVRDETLLIAFVDLDDFKLINDTHGHEAGDRVLRAFSSFAAHEIRRGDRFGRMGGDEFALALRVANVEEGRRLGTRLHERLTGVLAQSCASAACSMGALVVPPDHGRSYRDLIREADELMYRAKRDGGNMARVATAQARQRARAPAPVPAPSRLARRA